MTENPTPSDDYILGLKDGGLTQVQIAELLGTTLGTIAGKIKRRREALTIQGVEFPQVGEVDKENRETVTINSDGSHTSDRLVLMMEEESKSPRRLLELHNYDPDKWILIDATNNLWHMKESWMAGGGNALLYQSKIRCRPIGGNDFSWENIEALLASLPEIELPKIAPLQYDPEGEILEICLADLHTGKKNFYDYTDIEQAVEVVISDILMRCKGKKISKIYLVPLGDILHFDTKKRSTTAGQPLEYDGSSVQEMYEKALVIMIRVIHALQGVAPVEYIHIPGNHDYVLSFTLAKALQFYFKSDENVTIDTGHLSRKWRLMYNTLIGWAHGDMAKSNAQSWLMVEAREDWGKAKFAEVHTAHLHSQHVTEKNGLILRHVPSLNGTDEWHYGKGYVGSQKATVSFVYDQRGLREIWNTYSEPVAQINN